MASDSKTTDVEAGTKEIAVVGNASITSLPQASWNGPDDPENPYNWPGVRKLSVGVVCSVTQLVTTMSASMLVPALDQILVDLDLSSSTGQIAFSVFFLGLGLAPFLIAPLAEMYGRKPVWLAGNVVYIFWNAMCPVKNSPALMIIGRFLSGSGSSVGVALTGPVLADMYRAKDRGKALAIAGLLPYLGPALGPIVGGLAAQHLSWPWLFWILSIVDAFGMILGYFVIRESYAPVLLRHKANAQQRETTNNFCPKKPNLKLLREAWGEFTSKLGPAVSIPIRLLALNPAIQFVALGMALNFGIYTLVLSTFGPLWELKYNQTPTIASLNYIAIALGSFVCAQGGGRLMDLLWRRMKAARPDEEPTPEYRVPYMFFGFVPEVAGLFWYGWAAEKVTHWAAVDVGVGTFTCGSFMFSQALLAYTIDEFSSKYSASANAAARSGTYFLGFAFPIFAPDLYSRFGYGWGTSILGFILAGLGLLAILVLYFWGERLREIGRKRAGVAEE